MYWKQTMCKTFSFNNQHCDVLIANKLCNYSLETVRAGLPLGNTLNSNINLMK